MKALYNNRVYTITSDMGTGLMLDDIRYVDYAHPDLIIDPTDAEVAGAEGWGEVKVEETKAPSVPRSILDLPPEAPEADPIPLPLPDPSSRSRKALARVAPTLKTRRERVLDCLQRGKDQWIPGEVLRSPAVGGSEALRRVRELTAAGWPIARQPAEGKRTTWVYKLTSAPQVDSRQLELPLADQHDLEAPQ